MAQTKISGSKLTTTEDNITGNWPLDSCNEDSYSLMYGDGGSNSAVRSTEGARSRILVLGGDCSSYLSKFLNSKYNIITFVKPNARLQDVLCNSEQLTEGFAIFQQSGKVLVSNDRLKSFFIATNTSDCWSTGLPKSTNNISKRITYRPITEQGLFYLYNTLEDINWSFIVDTNLDLDFKADTFVNIVTEALETCFPLKFRMAGRNSSVNWFTDELVLLRDKLSFFRQLRSKGRNIEVSCERLGLGRSNLQSALWDIINGTRFPGADDGLGSLNATLFNNYFVSIPDKIGDGLPQTDIDPLSFFRNDIDVSFAFQEVPYSVVRSIFDN
ncbi:reverse transcriptase (rna-dependent dna polymerase) [Holotrichia oblita]|uniref:Reverse transcriptase (Rna-dependent dna polymerase) n=1 Tax=Holotrichia oblita TaxID=644536 RepID=A0ACB9SLB8_HOLOL|nr:reverse transcriptase (rna-dependent dna polymerase) [Holotrichia oblita]